MISTKKCRIITGSKDIQNADGSIKQEVNDLVWEKIQKIPDNDRLLQNFTQQYHNLESEKDQLLNYFQIVISALDEGSESSEKITVGKIKNFLSKVSEIQKKLQDLDQQNKIYKLHFTSASSSQNSQEKASHTEAGKIHEGKPDMNPQATNDVQTQPKQICKDEVDNIKLFTLIKQDNKIVPSLIGTGSLYLVYQLNEVSCKFVSEDQKTNITYKFTNKSDLRINNKVISITVKNENGKMRIKLLKFKDEQSARNFASLLKEKAKLEV
ncbi:hypothetical protein TRFO_31733 [Tritrichomonas foetus]|uniref:RanBD1 domain-containing protein n=1 Tax=Tritrichomonas foetus TaxID=1144522 RepID=A0A1J4JVA7_9EUKA|nr:hypothetical protein TRFO_31733 [Tritrichomonas foetus]|eukprot:OHT01462.1 hypothetical protein TRFO_31733 [Tritrichomonas foetus]